MRFFPASAIRASHSPERAVEHQQLGALAQPQHVAEIIGLPGVELDASALRSAAARTNRRGRLFGGQAGVAGIVAPA